MAVELFILSTENPSPRFYEMLQKQVKLKHHDDMLWLQKLPHTTWHNHYLTIIRECQDSHNKIKDCTQFLYAACPHLCLEHKFLPVTARRLDNYLKNYLGL